MNLFYVPCPDIETAEKISRILLEEKLLGCANILPQMLSFYMWQGSIEKSTEVVLLLKTTQSFEKIESRVSQLHPYETPCILQIPVAAINDSYKKWLAL